MKRSIVLCIVVLSELTACGKDQFPAVPDCEGRFLVVFSKQPSVDQGDIYLFDYDQLGFHALPSLNSTTLQERHPTMTRDVRFIAFERVLSATDSDILIYDPCQAEIVRQPNLNTAGPERDPAFSGDGNKLAFVRDTLGRREVRLYDGTTDRLVPLPGIQGSATAIDSNPVTNQSASLIAFSRNESGNDDVRVYDASGDSLIDLPDLASPGSDVDPSMTPDGHFLAFASDRGHPGDYDLYLYDLQARAFVTLPLGTNTPMTERHPSLNYSAQEIAFESNRTGAQGASDVYLLNRGTSSITSSFPSPSADVQPWIVWQ